MCIGIDKGYARGRTRLYYWRLNVAERPVHIQRGIKKSLLNFLGGDNMELDEALVKITEQNDTIVSLQEEIRRNKLY